MNTKLVTSTFNKHPAARLAAVLFVALLAFGNLAAQQEQEPKPAATPAAEAQDAPKIPNDQLESLVAPIALYPDPLLSQVLVASTYPLELVQLQQFLGKTGAYLSEKAVADAVQKEDWDPSIQAMAALPTVVKQLVDNIKWTQDLGNAFLAQQSDVMDAVQRMRTKAKDAGKLQSDEKMKVETTEVESKTVVVIQQSSPEVVYVPSYNPTVIWGAMSYPYPYMYYPPFGYYGAAYYGYGAGIAIGVAWGGGWGWGCGWGHNDINVNVNNNFNRNANINGGNRVNNIQGGNRVNQGGNKWQHNPSHRGGAPYSNRGTANRFGGSARGDSPSVRQSIARQNPSMRQSIARQNPGQFGGGQAGTMDRSGFGGGGRDMSNIGGNRASLGGGSGNRLGGDRVGSRDVSRTPSQRNYGSFGGSGSYGGGAARASSSRGASSMGGGGRGGYGGGGGMRGGGGGMRGGGGRRR